MLDDRKIVNLSELENEYKVKAVRLFVGTFYDMYTSISKDKKVLWGLQIIRNAQCILTKQSV